MYLYSALSDFRKFLRAGTLKNKFLIENELPLGQVHTSCDLYSDPSITTCIPSSESSFFVLSSTWAIAAIDAKASPLKPFVVNEYKSWALDILDVAWRSKQILASRSFIPLPLSITWIKVFPESLIMSLISVALESIEFSNNSLTADAGLWTTSPAAIWLATWSGSRVINI